MNVKVIKKIRTMVIESKKLFYNILQTAILFVVARYCKICYFCVIFVELRLLNITFKNS
jgi:hypothetical protein